MATLESLPSDQRAVLELVLARGKTYDEIAGMLSIDRASVRARALAAMDALGPQTRIPAERRALITDYLLGALPDRVAEEVRRHLAESAGERAWARVVASELEPIAASSLPEIPGAGEPAARGGEVAAAPASAAEPASTEPAPPGSDGRPPRQSSRLGGAVILGVGALIVVAVILVLVLTSGGSKHHGAQANRPSGTTGAAAPTTTTGTTTSTSTTPQFLGQVNLRPPQGGKALGVAQVLRQGGVTGVVIVAQGLAANRKRPANAYAVWLYNSAADSHLLGFVSPGVTSNGRLHTAGALPSNATRYQKLLITLESQSKPKTPGPIVLEGSLVGVRL